MKIQGDSLPSVHLGNPATVKTGDHVTALGAPLGLESTLSDGIISAVRDVGAYRMLQTSTPISHGSSGGPLFDDHGDVIGLAVATVEGGEPVLTSSIVIPAQVVSYDLPVPPQGARLHGSFNIYGGMGNDIGVAIVNANGGAVWNPGVINNNTEVDLRLTGGRYKLIFNNKVNAFWVANKTISGNVLLSYYR